MDTSALTEDQKTMFDKAENFCKGEYEGDTTALTTAMEDETATASVTLDAENGATLAKNVEKAYLKILTEGNLRIKCRCTGKSGAWRTFR